MKKYITYIAILLTAGFVALAPLDVALAQSPADQMLDGAGQTGTSGGQDVNSLIQTVVNVMFFILGAVAVIMIIWSGIRYVTSAGNQTAVVSAKNTLIYAVVGLIVALLAYAIVSFVIDALGK